MNLSQLNVVSGKAVIILVVCPALMTKERWTPPFGGRGTWFVTLPTK